MTIRRKTSTAAATFLAACLGTSALTPAHVLAAPAQAQAAQDFSISAQPLQSALLEFSRQSQSPVVASSSLLQGVNAPAVQGRMDEGQALMALLDGTGLIASRSSDGGWAISRKDAAAPQSGSAAGDGADAGTVQALIVTAQKREENIQDVPIAMSAFTQESLTRSQVAGGPDLMTQVPNMTFTKTNFSSYSIQIRGIGTQAISATTDPAVAVAFNNTPFIRNFFFEQEFYDLARVEVLRGPQGTLYGRNATAGVVNVFSAKANPARFEAKLSGDVSNYSSTRLEGMINLPLVEDKAALRIAGAWTKRDGYVTNILTGQQTDGRDLWSGRLTLSLRPTDNFSADLIYEHFQENDDRLRSGKQLCHKDPGPTEIDGVPTPQSGYALFPQFSQGCKPASLYSPDAFQTPNGFSLPYYGPAGALGAPVYDSLDPYASQTQSRDLRAIETHLKPDYEAAGDTVELQLRLDLSKSLTLNSETGFSRASIFSFEDYNRFDTTPGVFHPGAGSGSGSHPGDGQIGDRLDIVDANGVFCDPQLGCTNRLAAGDLSKGQSRQFAQEFRLSSNFEGAFNFNFGANFLRYDSEDKYYVFFNSLTAWKAAYSRNANTGEGVWVPGVSDISGCFETSTNEVSSELVGFAWSDPNSFRSISGCSYIDPNDIHHLNDEGRNYFLSRNPYNLLSYAIFGESYFQLTPQAKLTIGLRYTVDKKEAPQIPSWLLAGATYGTATRKVIRQEWREPTGRVALDWKPDLSFTDETLVYASYVRGYKAGGANPPPPIVVSLAEDVLAVAIQNSMAHPETFAPEFVNAYEVGTKNTLLDGHLTANLNGFYYDYTGYQISEIIDRSALNMNFDAKIWGAELELDWRPVENLHLGFKGGYENTRLADGSKAIDLMDRTAGQPGWILKKPFPTFPSNCVLPVQYAFLIGCDGYAFGIDPVSGLPIDPYTRLPYTPNPTMVREDGGAIVPISPDLHYPGFDPRTAPNFGAGFAKDISGNQLPNAPKFTATITADYTLPLPNDWLMTLHTDLYYQSEAWTRIFNTPGYDKLKAYNNINVAAIFTNEDAGWTVMAYVKNLQDKDNITGAFLNSDDSGLTTNVFLNEPRLYGLRVTKAWTGSDWWNGVIGARDHYPLRLEVDSAYGRTSGGREVLAPAIVAYSPADHPYPLGVQNDLDWGTIFGAKLTWQPQPKGWGFSAGVRYGRARGGAEAHPKWDVPGGLAVTQAKYDQLKDVLSPSDLALLNIDPSRRGMYSYATTVAEVDESHTIADFMVGRDVGLGALKSSRFEVGLRYAQLNSDAHVLMHGRPDMTFPEENILKYGAHLHRFHATMDAHRRFQGAGPAVSWEGAMPLKELQDGNRLDLDLGLGGAVLFGRQRVDNAGEVHGAYTTGFYSPLAQRQEIGAYSTSLKAHRSSSATVPGLNASLGLTYTLGGVEIGGGYRWERYFNAIDAGIETRKTYDRQFDGPYFKVAVGFGG